jgi:hypothetical protein
MAAGRCGSSGAIVIVSIQAIMALEDSANTAGPTGK